MAAARFRLVLLAGVLLAGGFSLGLPPANAAEPPAHETKLTAQRWSFAGVFGTFDRAQLQRGFQVYKDVCAFCHSLNLVAFRNLGEAGGPQFSPDEVKALAAQYQVGDGPNAAGEMFKRPGRPSDRFVPPFANDEIAKSNNNGAVPPDLSLIAKSRGVERGFPQFLFDFFLQYQEGGADYVHALLTGFQDPPAGVTVPPGLFYNTAFPSHAMAMPPPLSAGGIRYADGTPETVDQYAKDVAAFLMWAAEPHLVDRKRIGFETMIFLIVFAGLMYFTKKRVWAGVPH
ncbi:MAG: cytochrome c1 [Bauldia sp.]